MANELTSGQGYYYFDTVGSVTMPLTITGIHYNSGSTAGQDFKLTDENGKIIFETKSGSNGSPVNSPGGMKVCVDKMIVATIDAGSALIYTE